MTATVQKPSERSRVARYLPWMALSLAGAAACLWAAGATLGVFFGGFFVVTFLTPGAAVAERKLAALAAVAGPVALVWLAAALKSGDPIVQWAEVTVVLAAYALALGGMALSLEKLRLPKVLAAAVAIVIGLAWMTWPVWLSPVLQSGNGTAVVPILVRIHPPLVANGILTNEPAWTERSIAYHLTDLNQDVPIRLPGGIWACVPFHGLVGAVLWWVGARNPRKFAADGVC